MKFSKKLLSVVAIATFTIFSAAGTLHASITIAGANNVITPSSGGWSFDGSEIAPWRAAIENNANFGPGGVVNCDITTIGLNSVNAGTLAGVDVFFGAFVRDTEGAAFANDVANFFLGGGDLFLLSDDAGWDVLSANLGIATNNGTTNPTSSTGPNPLFDGPFGNVGPMNEVGNVGTLDEAGIIANGGTVVGRDANGNATVAIWNAGDYAAGAGRMIITSDSEFITPFGGASYDPLNNKGTFGLNSAAFFTNSVPEPGTFIIWTVFAGAGLAFGRRRRVN